MLVRDSGSDQPPGLTPRLFLLREGDRLFLAEKITGHFTPDSVKAGDNVVFLATGTGEAPHNYMAWELLRRGHAGKLLSACCVRYRRDLGYLPIHEELMRRHSNYCYLPLTTREADTIGQKVYIQDLITSGELESVWPTLDPDRTHVFLCGNPKMIGVPTKDREWPAGLSHPVGVIEILENAAFWPIRQQAHRQHTLRRILVGSCFPLAGEGTWHVSNRTARISGYHK